jgi:hypothetical protein
MNRPRTAPVLLGLALLNAFPAVANARAVALGAVDSSSSEAVAGAPVAIPVPRPPAFLTAAEVRATLERARGDLAACLPDSARHRRATVRATFSVRRGLALTVRATPREPAVEQCLDTAARRWLVPLEARPIGARLTASIQIRGVGSSVAPPPQPPPSRDYDEGLAHAALDARRAQILSCLPASTATPGDITLRLMVQTDGTLRLEGATLPAGVGGGPVLVCLSDVVASTRVLPPRTPRAVAHVVSP